MMETSEEIGVLSRLLHVLGRSLPMYLNDAPPSHLGDHEEIRQALANLVADQRLLAARVARAILDRGGRPDAGGFPTRFTDMHDLGIEFVLQLLTEHQRQDIGTIESCIAELSADPWLRSLAEEVLGNTKGHLDILEGLTAARAPRRA